MKRETEKKGLSLRLWVCCCCCYWVIELSSVEEQRRTAVVGAELLRLREVGHSSLSQYIKHFVSIDSPTSTNTKDLLSFGFCLFNFRSFFFFFSFFRVKISF